MPSLKHFPKLASSPHRPFRSLASSLPNARFVTSAHSSYVSSSNQAGMAEVMDEAFVPKTSSSRVKLDQLDPIVSRPDPLVLTPIKGALGFETVKKQDAIGRPIYLDMQVSHPLSPCSFFFLVLMCFLFDLLPGHYTHGPSSLGCHDAIHDQPIRKPTFKDTCVRMGN